MAGIAGIIREARRRRVFRVAGLYIVAAWVAVQVASELLPAIEVDAASIRYVWLAALLGFPLALVFGWLYDITSAGVQRTPPADITDGADLSLRRTDYLVLAALAVVAAGILAQVYGRVEAPAASQSPVDPLSIAVLPLENLSGDPEQAYFVAGMQDALIAALGKISGLRVTSRTSTLAFRDTTELLPAIARKLGVNNIVEGSVRRVGDKIQVHVQLVDAVKDRYLWESSYESQVSEVLRLQNEITRGIADEIQVELTQAESTGLASAGRVDPAAYEAFLQGKFHAERFTPEDMQLAVQYYQRAVELDPDNALPYWGLTRICRFQLQAGLVPPREGEPRCKEPLIRALELDDSLAEVHLGLATSYWLYDYNWPAAEASFRRALELNPSHAEARVFYAHFLAQMRRPADSTRQMSLAREVDPLNVFVKALHGAQRMLVGDDAGAIELLEECLRESPSLGFGYDVLWFSNERLGRMSPALKAAVQHFSMTMNQPAIATAIETAYTPGNYAGAMQAGAVAAEHAASQGYVPAVEIAALWSVAGDADRAFHWLDRAWEQHDPTLPYITTAVFLGDIRDDPRFANLLRRMRLDMWLDEATAQRAPGD